MRNRAAKIGPVRFATESSRLGGDRSAYIDLLRRMVAQLEVLGDESSVQSSALRLSVAGTDAASMKLSGGKRDTLHLLRACLDLLAGDASLSEADLAGSVASHLHDLVAIAMGAARDAEENTAGHGLRAARLKAVKADIDSNLACNDVRSEALAKRHRVSPRYIRKLFEGEGTSLSQFVLGRRLSLVHRRLLDHRCDHLTIGSIAFDAGFGDLSTFNHAFRKRFGATPSDVRQSARTGAPIARRIPAQAAAAKRFGH